MMVNGNVGTGVAVAGAFSLVRFRSAPGSAREIGAIFAAMGAGLMAGMGYLGYAALFALILGGITMAYHALGFGGGNAALRCRTLHITIPEDLDYTGVFDPILAQYATESELKQVKTTNMGSLFKLTYDLTLRDGGQEKALIDALRQRNGNLEISCASRRPDRPDYEQEESYETNRYAPAAEPFAAAQRLPDTDEASSSSTPAPADTEPVSVIDPSDLFSDRDLDGSYDESTAIPIQLTGETAVCTSDAVSIDGTQITLLDEGTYLVSGSLTDGQIVVDADDTDKVQIVLAGAAITCADSAAIYSKTPIRCFLLWQRDGKHPDQRRQLYRHRREQHRRRGVLQDRSNPSTAPET